jgi:hypothetical protein
METVIVIPLYMILLGGIFWIGDLIVTRQQLVVAERYVAWNTGLRYADKGQTDAGTLHRLFFADADGTPNPWHRPTASDGKIDKAYDWSHAASGQVKLSVNLPDWLRYMFNTGHQVYDAAAPAQVQELRGRDRQDQRHVVLMRTKPEWEQSYIRNKYGTKESGQVAQKWQDIAGEKWPYE